MFGYISTNPKALSKEEKDRYKKYYCGLCHQLNTQYGGAGRAMLSYDMTFLIVLLSSIYGLEESQDSRHCVRHLIKSQPYVETLATAYGADLNIILGYYQLLDDWKDDGNLIARENSRVIKKYLPRIIDLYPHQCDTIVENMRQLSEMERVNELNPDLPANCFGELMGELFVWKKDEHTDTLRRMGAALGRFIYLLDAVNDLKTDIRKQRYNPLVSQMDTDYTPLLTIMMAECTSEFEKLPVERDIHILQNILYSGVWQKYRARKRKGQGE